MPGWGETRPPGPGLCHHSAVPSGSTTAGPRRAGASTRTTVGGSGARLRHRPALDGLRGLAVASCLTYQMIPGHFTGGWLGIDMFLTLSGFFIAAMLVQEQRATGRIHYWTFLKRRGRRLLPGHLLMLAGVAVLTPLLAPRGRWQATAGDIAASVVEMVNWRFISADESYFDNQGMPSPLRHMWSLSVQEQYYVLFPLVLLGISRWARTMRAKVAFFAGLAGLSLWRMIALYEPGTDPSRVYFGTDTRIFEVLIGVIAALLLSERAFSVSLGRAHRGWLADHDRELGWVGLAGLGLLFWWMLTLSEYSPWLFQGGLAAVCGLTLIAIVAASSPRTNLLQRLLSWAPLRWVGRMGFSLYIWHWPLVVFTGLALPALPHAAQNVLSMLLTLGIGYLSNTYLETPIHVRGIRGLFPRRPGLRDAVALGTVPALLLSSFVLSTSATRAGAGGVDPAEDLHLSIPAYHPRPDAQPVVLFGNSVAAGVAERRDTGTAPDLAVDLISSLGCDPFVRDAVRSDRLLPVSTQCLDWRARWPAGIKRDQHPLVAYFLSPNLFEDFRVDGRTVSPMSPEHDATVTGVLDELRTRAARAGAGGFVLVNLACHRRVDFGTDPAVTRSNDLAQVQHLNALAGSWARRHRVRVIDVYATLCPGGAYRSAVDGLPLYDDAVHYSTDSAPVIYAWLAPQLQAAASARGTADSGVADLAP